VNNKFGLKGSYFFKISIAAYLATAGLASGQTAPNITLKCIDFYKSNSQRVATVDNASEATIASLAALEHKYFYGSDSKDGKDVLGQEILNRLESIAKTHEKAKSSKPWIKDQQQAISIVKSLLKSITESKVEKNVVNKNDVEGLEDFILKYLDIIEGKQKESLASFNELGSTIMNEYKLSSGPANIYASFNRAFEVLFGKEEAAIRKARLKFCK
jgi:hypothetical protein